MSKIMFFGQFDFTPNQQGTSKTRILCFPSSIDKMASAAVWNADNGFVDGILRGYKSGILNSSHYLNLTQCETVEGMKNIRVRLR
jgi:hypothetical protein